MEGQKKRLYFIDAMRAWAILMMLQGHFIDGLLDPAFRNDGNLAYSTWKYFRGITAPVFFTVSGFIFTFLLVRVPETGWKNPRVRKGIKRGLELLLIGYLLRLNLWGLLDGQLYPSFFLVDVLHCIGLSLIGIVGIYLLSKQGKFLFPLSLLTVTLLLFLFEPYYKTLAFTGLPDFLVNYVSKANGSVFTVFPWLGYTAFGAFLSLVFSRFRQHRFLYPAAITLCLGAGLWLMLYSSGFFVTLGEYTGITLFNAVYANNYLFIRLGDVLVVFALFMLVRNWLSNRNLLRIGQNTLSIYVIHFILLYGSFTGLGLYRYLHHDLNPYWAIPGALLFMFSCTVLALKYETHEPVIKSFIAEGKDSVLQGLEWGITRILRLSKALYGRLLRLLARS